MNKNEFLSALAKKLSVLNDSEKEDIISEYTDTINEKVKNGMNEKEAVKDFGDIDDLAKEILKAYKINPDYENNSESFSQKSEAAIKRGAGKIADFSRRLASKFKNANELSLELLFEIVIKVFLVLIGLAILGMCFDCLCDIGEGLLGHSFVSPYSEILVTIWYLFIFSIFVLLGVMLVTTAFKKYFEGNNQKSSQHKALNTKKEDKQVKNGTTIGDVLILIVKIFVIVWLIVPLMFMDLLAIVFLVLTIVYLIKGLDLFGLSLIMIGIVSVITYLIILLFKLILNKTKLSIIPLIVSTLFIIVGGVMFTFSVMSIDYYDKAPKGIKMETLTTTLNVNENAHIHYNNFYNREQDIKKITDNTLKDGEIKLDIAYNKDCYNVSVDEEVIKEDCDGTCSLEVVHYININADSIDDINSAKVAYKLFIDNLKNKKVYNYHKIFTGNLKITANEATLAKIAINNY